MQTLTQAQPLIDLDYTSATRGWHRLPSSRSAASREPVREWLGVARQPCATHPLLGLEVYRRRQCQQGWNERPQNRGETAIELRVSLLREAPVSGWVARLAAMMPIGSVGDTAKR